MKLVIRLTISRSEMSFWKRLCAVCASPNPPYPGPLPATEIPASPVDTREAFGFTDKGHVRANNEDYFRVEPELGLYAVADGMGGAEAGEYAARLAVDTVTERLVSAERRDLKLLLAAMQEAN